MRLVASAWPELEDRLDPGDCIHVTLTLEVGDATQVVHGACIRDWVATIARAQDALAGSSCESELIHVRAARAYVRLSRDRPHLACDARDLQTALDAFLAAIETTIAHAHPDGARWWADAHDRAVRARSELSP